MNIIFSFLRLAVVSISDIFKYSGDQILVDTYGLELYLPFEYSNNGFYRMLGNKVEWLGIANYKAFGSEKEMENRDAVPTYPIAISGFITSKPFEVDIGDVKFVKGGVERHSLILRFFKNDIFVVNKNIIKSVDNLKAIMSLLESGKLENIPVEHIPSALNKAQETSNVKLALSQSYLDVIAIEHYRNPDNVAQKYRHGETNKTGAVRAINAREESMSASTFQMVSFEDINTSMLASCNRDDKGIRDEATAIEKIIKGSDDFE